MASEKPSRQTAIATGSAAERRTSGPANEIPTSDSASIQSGFRDMTKKKPVPKHRLFFRRTLVCLLGFHQAHLRRRAPSALQNLVVVAVTVRSVATTDAAVVAKQRHTRVRRVTDRLLQDLHTVTDVALDVEQVRRAASPLTTVEGHDLHQAARADRAAGVRVEGRVFREKNADEQRRVDLLLVSLIDDRISDTEGKRAIVSVLVQYLTDEERLLRRLRSIDDGRWQSQQPAWVGVKRVLLGNRPHGSAHEQPTQCNGMGCSAHSGLHR